MSDKKENAVNLKQPLISSHNNLDQNMVQKNLSINDDEERKSNSIAQHDNQNVQNIVNELQQYNNQGSSIGNQSDRKSSKDEQELQRLRSQSLATKPRKSVYQALKEKLTDVKDVNWEENTDGRSIFVGEEVILYPNNKIKTSRYNIISFLPLNMFEQFSKVSNIYFLLMGLLQMVKPISNSEQLPTVYIPLLFIVFVAALKDILEDLKRHSSDKDENHYMTHKAVKIQDASFRQSSRLTLGGSGKFQDTYSENLKVGNLIKVRQNEQIPADIIVLRCSDPKGSCFVETKNLDGETNLKPKFITKDILNNIYPDDRSLLNKKVKINYESPNPLLYKFNGNISVVDEQTDRPIGNQVSLDEKNIMLRGCVLRNTKWIYGIVIYTGHETKIMLNAHTPDIKQSSVEKKMSRYILVVCIIQFFLCLFGAVYYIIWYSFQKDNLVYLDITSDDFEETPILSLVVTSGIWLMSILNMVPIALLVTLEMVRFMQAIVISKEKLMKSYNGFEPTVQSSNLNEDLGQIQCIFSDKTGTLTCNIMNFKCLFVNGISYGSMQDRHHKKEEIVEQKKIPNVNFHDPAFYSIIEDPSEDQYDQINFALLHLSLCHSVIISEKEQDTQDAKRLSQMISDTIQKRTSNQDSQIQQDTPQKEYEYQAASPDDLALVNFAKYSGFEYMGSDAQDVITINNHQKKYYMPHQMFTQEDIQKTQTLKFQTYHVLEFTSDRKRMSIILKDLQTNKIMILTKGADSIVLKRVNKQIYSETQSGLEFVQQLQYSLDEYAKIGLRTLLLAQRELTQQEFDNWDARYKQASSSLQNREERMNTLMDEIEQNLEIVGATAIEDKLQDDVEGTISCLKEAGILFWILTGDKKETAINIGLSTKVLETTDKVICIDNQDTPLLKQMEDMLLEVSSNKKQTYCLVVTGEMLTIILEEKELSSKLISIGSKCKSVIACRVSPKQKKEIVTIYRKSEEGFGKRTLAIGDGANDVNMITEAHVGIGIKGLEGMQAARSSDYAIGEFKILRRLLLYHGRECYRRNSIVILYNLYKNTMYLCPLIFFGFNSGFSGSNLYDIYIYQMYNAMFTAFPIILFAVLDRNLSSKVLVKSPHLYKTGIEGVFLNYKEFLLWFGQGLSHAAIIYYFVMYSLDSVLDLYHIADLVQIGQVIFMLTIFVANFKVIIHQNTSFSVGYIIQFLSFLVYFLLEIFANYYLNYDLYNILTRIFSQPYFYLVFILVMGATVFLDYSLVIYKDFMYFMKLADEYRERYQKEGDKAKLRDKTFKPLYEDNVNVYQIRKTLKGDYPDDTVESENESSEDESPQQEKKISSNRFKKEKPLNLNGGAQNKEINV
ncbi:phospholipid-translocating P-type ATPase, flippase family protein (macronuclear) [Tetrahymena thermophila SB210]|uniref:Phospholipid-transporting ATPase n=1 Tax=Tetrahymena thermophila (strain SB210) TaxID=312017 RepID=I7M4B7_TETTS|nr:phospholipid-translocating P-type ATPase, flippase family protein [Tetrahymena thermophila SB210]EAS06174.1 phospholipid-translocating P-type ATPase, flippase family protein [Tetrahymena thermophila SB210]|eukprot:XP_001026419.1 phospholipid-translocating P-type ATPase, flippase family protein [Tetrahymena thermophila SB210]